MVEESLETELREKLKDARSKLNNLVQELTKLKGIARRFEVTITKNQQRSVHRLVDYRLDEVSSEYNTINDEIRRDAFEALEFQIKPKIIEKENLITIQRKYIEKINLIISELSEVQEFQFITLKEFTLLIKGEVGSTDLLEVELQQLKKLKTLKEEILQVHVDCVKDDRLIQQIVAIIKGYTLLRNVHIENSELINSQVIDICNELNYLNLDAISFKNNLIDVQFLMSVSPTVNEKTTIDYSKNVVRPNSDYAKFSDIAKQIQQKIRNAIISDVDSLSSYLDDGNEVSKNFWHVYILASKVPFYQPSHASLVVEGVDENGLHVLSRSHLVPKINCSSPGSIFLSIFNNYSVKVEYMYGKNVKEQIEDIKLKNIYFGFSLKRENAIALLDDVSKDCEKIEASFGVLPSLEKLTCLRWILMRVNKYRKIEGLSELTGEAPFAMVEEHQKDSNTIELHTMRGHYENS